jgi:vWA-MoxR associated protein C-terminal domain/vWA-MoxR associated protein middle region (VMAP-M) 1/Effector-associated domain 9
VSQSYEIRLKQRQLRDLEIGLEGLEADSEALSQQLNSMTNAADRRRIEQQRTGIYAEMTRIAEQCDLLQQEIKQQRSSRLPDADVVLWDILAPYENQQDIVVKLERTYLSSARLPNFPRPIPTTLRGKLADLENMQPDQSGCSPLLKFVAYVVCDRQLPELLSQKLTEWAEQQTREFSKILEQVKQQITAHQQPKQSCLMVVVERSLSTNQQMGDRYTAKAWFIADENLYQRHSGIGVVPLTIPGDWGAAEPTFTGAELESLLPIFLAESSKYGLLQNLTIELFLPAELLNEPVDSWGMNDDDDLAEPIGCQHCLIIRSSDRLHPKYFLQKGGFWKAKWDEMPTPGERRTLEALILGDNAHPRAISQQLKQPHMLGLKFAKEPLRVGKNTTFAALQLAAAPVAIWLRQPLPEVDAATMDRLLDCCPYELSVKVKQQRQAAFSEDPDSHMGHHLALLWENFDRLPPDFDFPYAMA